VIPVCNLKRYYIRDGAVVEELAGYRVACQNCPHIFSIAPRGTFKHHPQSSPLVPEVSRPVYDEERPPEGGPIPPQAMRPIPKRAPGV
jgi:hypothetical protein